jgi:hypothetical protein
MQPGTSASAGIDFCGKETVYVLLAININVQKKTLVYQIIKLNATVAGNISAS